MQFLLSLDRLDYGKNQNLLEKNYQNLVRKIFFEADFVSFTIEKMVERITKNNVHSVY